MFSLPWGSRLLPEQVDPFQFALLKSVNTPHLLRITKESKEQFCYIGVPYKFPGSVSFACLCFWKLCVVPGILRPPGAYQRTVFRELCSGISIPVFPVFQYSSVFSILLSGAPFFRCSWKTIAFFTGSFFCDGDLANGLLSWILEQLRQNGTWESRLGVSSCVPCASGISITEFHVHSFRHTNKFLWIPIILFRRSSHQSTIPVVPGTQEFPVKSAIQIPCFVVGNPYCSFTAYFSCSYTVRFFVLWKIRSEPFSLCNSVLWYFLQKPSCSSSIYLCIADDLLVLWFPVFNGSGCYSVVQVLWESHRERILRCCPA